MKKNYFFGLFAATMLLTTSCQQENIFTEMWGEKEQTVTLNIALPEMGTDTRAVGDGTTATKLQYAIFDIDANGNRTVLSQHTKKDETLNNKTYTLKAKLMIGHKYGFVCWASAAGAPFEVDIEAGTMKLNAPTNGFVNNEETYDAFFGYKELTLQGGTNANNNYTIFLKRPFAQLNIACTDFASAEAAGFKITETEVTVASYQELNLISGVASNNAEIKFKRAGIDKLAGETFPTSVTGMTMSYISMNYLLMDKDQEVKNTVKFNAYDEDGNVEEKTYNNIRFKRNFRTNIYGELFTNDVNISITVDPFFADQTDEDENGSGDNPSHDDKYDGENGDFSAYDTTNP